MTDPDIKVKIIPQLKDNYSYVVYSGEKKLAAIIDPAESTPIIDFIQKNSLTIETIILTHHHDDHTAGVQEILNFSSVSVYSPDKKISRTSRPSDIGNTPVEYALRTMSGVIFIPLGNFLKR